MSADGIVPDWEYEEIRQELLGGEAPDIVAYRHGLPPRKLDRFKTMSDKPCERTRTPQSLFYRMKRLITKGSKR